ncbi:hypothetical protein [Novosphingobium sp. Leaf2]|uniref:hypothetical protein n=1 Tax=Novosphingobium sp. Leaf2 TaxID=1735670 RepID=UPI00070082D2|nr:hypothetical protein [Novosphingobium sp. Leaf2]KQM21762.1 hypothetical protein ASE49_00060 [Novosphingobium sp. Leaf2]
MIRAEHAAALPRSRALQSCVLAALAAVMLATRTHSLSNYIHLPDTSLASFFVLGYFVRQPLGFAALFALGFAIDIVVIYVLGGSGFCFTPAYWMLVPAYGVMWGAGRYAAERLGERAVDLLPAAALLVGATVVSQLLSSGGFYFLGGRYPDASLAGFAPRMERYLPAVLIATLVWTGLAAAIWTAVLAVAPDMRRQRQIR